MSSQANERVRRVATSIRYIFALPTSSPEEASPFQGFSFGLFNLAWALRDLVLLPANLVEAALPREATLARRAAGAGGWFWAPLEISSLVQIDLSPEDPFWVVFTAMESDTAAVVSWADQQEIRPLVIAPQALHGATKWEDVDHDAIREFARTTLGRVKDLDSRINAQLATECMEGWREKADFQPPIPSHSHNALLPNIMTLQGADFVFGELQPFVGRSNREYISAIADSARAVLDVRSKISFVDAFRHTPPGPDLIVTAPSFYTFIQTSRLAIPEGGLGDPIRRLLTLFQRQNDYTMTSTGEVMHSILSSPDARLVLKLRQDELEVHTLTVGIRAASSLAATIRLPPSANRGTGALRHLATHARGGRLDNTRKLVRLFAAVQDHLREVVGHDLLEIIGSSSTGIKIVSDAPLEWLPIGELPLGLRFDVSRITSTPGNLMVGSLVMPPILRLRRQAFQEVLVISAFDSDDPIRSFLATALKAFEPAWTGKLALRQVNVQSEAEFVAAVNAFHGAVMIYDGHARSGDSTEPGALILGRDAVDVWTLRGRVRAPPIVILSACDTIAIDGSHASVANGFLAIGTRTVLGTLLPVNALSAASFAARLVYRLADFLPAALKDYGRALRWTEVVGGMLRMQAVTDILHGLIQESILAEDEFERCAMIGNDAINSLKSDWLQRLVKAVSERAVHTEETILAKIRSLIPLSDAIRYVQVGNPESILIDEEERFHGERPQYVVDYDSVYYRDRS